MNNLVKNKEVAPALTPIEHRSHIKVNACGGIELTAGDNSTPVNRVAPGLFSGYRAHISTDDKLTLWGTDYYGKERIVCTIANCFSQEVDVDAWISALPDESVDAIIAAMKARSEHLGACLSALRGGLNYERNQQQPLREGATRIDVQDADCARLYWPCRGSHRERSAESIFPAPTK